MAYNQQQNPSTNQGQYGQGPMDKVANAIPGHHTGAPGSMPGSNNPSGHAGQYDNTTSTHSGNPLTGNTHGGAHHDSSAFGSSNTGLGGAGHHGATTTGAGYGSSNTGAGYGSSNTNSGLASATHGTHEHGLNQGPADKLANMIPGHNTGAPGAVPGSHNPSGHDSTSHSGSHGTSHGTHGTHGSSNYDSNSGLNSATHGTHEHGLNQGPSDRLANAAPGHHTGAPGAVPGSHNPSHNTAGERVHEHNQHSGTMSGGGFGAGEARAHDSHHTTGTHAGSHNTTTGAHDAHNKSSMADKIGGKIDVMVGKATKNEEKIMQGEIKQTEGKAGLEHNSATGAGRI